MSRPAQRIVALAAAVCYGVLALASHGLHDWVGCTSADCGSVAEHSGSDCCHDGDHALAAKPGSHKTSAEQSFRSYAAGHDAANCAVCAWVAKLKTSVFAVAAAPLVTQTVTPSVTIEQLLTPIATPLALEARGPPASQA